MDLKIEGRTALISGSTAGIGWAIAKRLASEGAAVVLNGRTQARVDEAVERLEAEVPNASVRGIAADLGSADGVALIAESLPQVDILVNNVGIFEPAPFLEIDDANWMRHFEVNVMSGVRLTRLYLGGMKERGWGRVVFISSESGCRSPRRWSSTA
ncbi:MAG: SDR family NAD(P)-dependent oxidoreductase [Bryobacterales bacterium]